MDDEKTIARIKEMETRLDRALEAITKMKDTLDEYESVREDIRQLETYYSSRTWLDDFEADEAGLLPQDLKRGVLSEDGISNMLEEYGELEERLRSENHPEEIKNRQEENNVKQMSDSDDKESAADTETLLLQVRGFLDEEPYYASALSNISALLMDAMPELNWAGFYLMREGRLVVGPFQGKPACIHIEVGRGVCGTAALRDETVVVPDVHRFPGHIACDSASNSEIVIPVHRDGAVAGVLDMDSPLYDRFSGTDRKLLEDVVRIIEENVKWE